jgi:hypothetical protein
MSRLSRPCAWTRCRGCIGAKAELNVMEAGLYTDTVHGFRHFIPYGPCAHGHMTDRTCREDRH